MRKLILGFSSVLVLLVIIIGITYYQFSGVDRSYTEMIEDRTNKIELATYANYQAYKEQISLRSFLITGNEEDFKEYEENRAVFQSDVESLRNLTNTEEGLQVIDNIIAAEEAYNEAAQQLIALKRQGNEEYIRLMQQDSTEAVEKIEAAAKELLFFQQDNLAKTSDQLSEKTQFTIWSVVALGIISIIIGLIIAIFISRGIAKNVKLVSASAEEIANGNLTIGKVVVKSKDEVAQLAQSFNIMTDNLRTLIKEVSQTSEQVAASSEELLASAEETTAATNQVANSITSVASSVEVQGKNTEESAQGINEITLGITRIAENASAVAMSSAHTTEQASKGNDNIQNVVKQMNTIYNANSETNEVMQQLEKRSTEIGKIIDVITDIADQTNLLALNAAIESARAGEHGKGFAVVADEVGKLAEQSRQSANQIAEIIQIIQSDTVKAVELMNNGNEEVTDGLNLAVETGKAFNVILQSIENANEQALELSATSEQMSASVQQVNASIDEVSQLAKTSSEKAIEIAAVTEQQLASSEEVSTAASSLAEMAEELRKIVSKFKV